ncbi:MFS transporter [soil metagenome]
MSLLTLFALCGFASAFALRIPDPLVLPIAHALNVAPHVAALMTTAFALPYAVAQPFLGPLGDRIGKQRLMRVCIAVLTVALTLGAVAPTIEVLLASRVCAGVFAGGIIPLALATIGDRFELAERQVAIGRFLVAVIGGQMLGAAVSGALADLLGWRASFGTAACIAGVTAALAWNTLGVPDANTGANRGVSSLALFKRVFANPKAVWLYPLVFIEGAAFFGLFPYMGEILLQRGALPLEGATWRIGIVLGAFGIGGIAYALLVRRIIGALGGVRRMVLVGACGSGVLFLALTLPGPWWRDAIVMLLAGVCFYMIHNSLQVEATEIAPTARGSAVALFASAYFGGQAFGPVFLGPVGHASSFTVALVIVAGTIFSVGLISAARLISAPTLIP